MKNTKLFIAMSCGIIATVFVRAEESEPVDGRSENPVVEAVAVQSIDAIEFSERDASMSEVTAQFEAVQEHLERIGERGAHLTGEAEKVFDQSMKDARSREREVRTSITMAKGATEANWPSVRSGLSASYDAYVLAVARAEARAEAGAKRE